VEILEEGMRHKFFPELWEIRGHMTDAWGSEYGVKRDTLGGKVIIADGYHRVCAVYRLDEDAIIPCKIV
jgi:hypothetical protein